MRWQCAECGRPREERDGACDCGATGVEPTTVRLTQRCTTCGEALPEHVNACPECGFTSLESLYETEGDLGTSYVEWRCTECGRGHPRNNPPCSRCGGMTFERHRVDAEDVEIDGDGPLWSAVDPRTVALVLAVLALLVAATLVL